MTAPNPVSVSDLTIPAATLGERGLLALGFRQDWLSGKDDDTEVTITSGAGLGSPYLILTVERPGKATIHEAIDMRDVLPKWAEAAIARADALDAALANPEAP